MSDSHVLPTRDRLLPPIRRRRPGRRGRALVLAGAILVGWILAAPSGAQGAVPRVVTVPADPTRPNDGPDPLPHPAWPGRPFTLKAIARGIPGNVDPASVSFRWDTDLDGDFGDEVARSPRQCVADTPTPGAWARYDVGLRVLPPDPPAGPDLLYAIELRVPGLAPFGAVPAQADPDDAGTARPQDASPRQREIMRAAAIDEALWWIHRKTVDRTGSGAGLTGALLSSSGFRFFDASGLALWALQESGHHPAWPPGTYDHAIGAAAGLPAPPPLPADFLQENDRRYRSDPYAETALRLMDHLIAGLVPIAIPPLDELPVGAGPAPGTRDGVGLGAGPALVGEWIGPAGTTLAALASTGLGPAAAQVGDPAWVRGYSLAWIVQSLIDHLAYLQNDGPGDSWGTWGFGSPTDGHGGATLWALIGLEAATTGMGHLGVAVPDRVLERVPSALWQMRADVGGQNLIQIRQHQPQGGWPTPERCWWARRCSAGRPSIPPTRRPRRTTSPGTP